MTQNPSSFHLSIGGREAKTPTGHNQAERAGGLIKLGFQVPEHSQKFLGGELPFQVEMEQAIGVKANLVSAHAENINDKWKIINQNVAGGRWQVTYYLPPATGFLTCKGPAV